MKYQEFNPAIYLKKRLRELEEEHFVLINGLKVVHTGWDHERFATFETEGPEVDYLVERLEGAIACQRELLADVYLDGKAIARHTRGSKT